MTFMTLLPLLLLTSQVGPPSTPEARFERCVDLATGNPAAGAREAGAWLLAGGGFLARQCEGMAETARGNYRAAAQAFEEAARSAEVVKDSRSANYWAQAGNAWLAASDPARARGALDAALASPALTGMLRGEAELDRARALFASGDRAGARTSLDHATRLAPEDPLAWLLSATLARQTGELARAQKDIAEALRLSADDASVQLEAGNIAAVAGDESGARLAWTAAARLARDPAVQQSAKGALAQLQPTH